MSVGAHSRTQMNNNHFLSPNPPQNMIRNVPMPYSQSPVPQQQRFRVQENHHQSQSSIETTHVEENRGKKERLF